MKKYTTQIRVFTLIISFFAFGLVTTTANAASQIHELREPLLDSSNAVGHPSAPAWLFTEYDEDTGYTQVFYQYLTSTSSTDEPEKIKLTESPFDKFLPKWGKNKGSTLQKFATAALIPSSTYMTQCVRGQNFYFLGDENGNGTKELYVSCVEGFATSSATVPADMETKLTDIPAAPSTEFDIVDYDAPREANTLIGYDGTWPSGTAAYGVVFTTSDGMIHLLQHDIAILVNDITGYLNDYVVHDYADTGGLFNWGNFSPSAIFEEYKSVKLDAHAYNIIFLGRKTGETDFQIGTMHITSWNELQLTDIDAEITNPNFHHSIVNSSSWGIVHNIFFEVTENNTTRLAHLTTRSSIISTMQWCDTARYLTDETRSRLNLTTKWVNAASGSPNHTLAYELYQPDGFRDIYAADLEPLDCTGTTSDGDPFTLDTVIVTDIDDQVELITNERQLTCQNDNTAPFFLHGLYFDEDFNYIVPSPNDYDSIGSTRNWLDGSGKSYSHIYNVAEETEECADTCYETADGDSLVTDGNGFDDGDGFADFCETLPNVDIGLPDPNAPLNPFPCEAGTEPYIVDTDDDGINDSCDVISTQTSVPVTGGYVIHGGSCELKTSQQAFVQNKFLGFFMLQVLALYLLVRKRTTNNTNKA